MTEDLQTLLTRLARERAPAEERSDTQARIVAAALELFAERSYEAATTQAIAQRAGVTEKTLFRHFGSKERLFTETVYPALFRLIEPLANADLRAFLGAADRDFRGMIRAIVADRVRFGVRHPAIMKMVAQEMLLRPAFREAFWGFVGERMLPHVLAVFDRARAAGELRDVDSAVAVRTMVSVVGGYMFMRTIGMPEADWDDELEIDRLTDVILNGLACRPAEA